MAVQLYRPNLDIIRQQAQAAREQEQKRKEDKEFKWGELEEGDNIIRLLPPTNSRGILWKLVAKHYFNKMGLKDLDSNICVAEMFSDVAGVQCATCNQGDRILAQMPQLEIKTWHKPGTSYYVQAVDRKDQKPVARLYRLTPHIKNWLSMQMETLLIDNIDLTDVNTGLDIKITRTTKKTKRGERTEYTPTIWSPRGPTPISPDPAVAQAVLNSMVDPDEIWKYPSDETLADISKTAATIMSYYMKESYKQPGVHVQVPGMSTPQTPMAVAQPTPAQPAPAVPYNPVIAQPVAAQAPAAPVVLPVAQPPAAVASPPRPNIPASTPAAQVAQQIVHLAAGTPPNGGLTIVPQQPVAPGVAAGTRGASPTDKPICFGGAKPRPDGGIGYNDGSEVCLMCPHELICMDTCKAAGIEAT